ncbi:MAG: hypothetical protein HUU22_19815 [Phycisphaerae bacterium]|nr:hypothetical protein [Phycisphaerae bacterium]
MKEAVLQHLNQGNVSANFCELMAIDSGGIEGSKVVDLDTADPLHRQHRAAAEVPVDLRDMNACVVGELGCDAPVVQRACPLFVPCVEEGRDASDAIVQALAREYLQPLIPLAPAVMILGCTHYPLLRDAIAAVMGPKVALVDSGEETARGVEELLRQQALLARAETVGSLTCYVSDNPQRLREVGQRFLCEPIRDVTCVSPEEFHAGESAHV